LTDDEEDLSAVLLFHKRLAAGEEELIPSEFVNRMIDGENKVRVWREHRGLSARDLAEKAGISVEELARIEDGEPDGHAVDPIASALRLAVDDLR